MSGPQFPYYGGGPPGPGYPTGGYAPSFGSVPQGQLTVGQLADAVLVLSTEERNRLYAILGVAPIGGVAARGGAGGPTPTTTRPKDGRTFKVQAPKERSAEETQLMKSVEDAKHALKGYTTQKGYKSEKDSQGTWVAKTADGVAVKEDETLSRLQDTYGSALSALHAFKASLRPQGETPAQPVASSSGAKRGPLGRATFGPSGRK